jgi:hypothetical protein
MENGKLLGQNSTGRRENPRTFPGIPLKRLKNVVYQDDKPTNAHHAHL